MSLNNDHMLPARIRNMRQMKDVLDAEDIILAELEAIIDDMYQRAAMLHEELVNEAWLENKLEEKTGADVEVTADAEQLLVNVDMDVSSLDEIDIESVRKFLEKWLPAHLQYDLMSLLKYANEHTEEFLLQAMDIQTAILFWKVRTLDGTWLLDGSCDLGAVRKDDAYGIAYDIGEMDFSIGLAAALQMFTAMEMAGKIRMPQITAGFTMLFWKIRTLDGTWLLDGAYGLEQLRKEDAFGMVFSAGEAPIPETWSYKAITVKDLWYLDGTYTLNGTKILDAERQEEEL